MRACACVAEWHNVTSDCSAWSVTQNHRQLTAEGEKDSAEGAAAGRCTWYVQKGCCCYEQWFIYPEFLGPLKIVTDENRACETDKWIQVMSYVAYRTWSVTFRDLFTGRARVCFRKGQISCGCLWFFELIIPALRKRRVFSAKQLVRAEDNFRSLKMSSLPTWKRIVRTYSTYY